ncbi:hypothetical protein GCM10011571_32040 [Marinithermofilum abyssi]|uniref:Uncharacterized protein n=1 Tax=Marinithermofilum abyssi TaxID=1571185 RepID=A0A8J2VJM8_9BACL|nr:hypothetical protein [Marinithermofilum abyssi]GGE27412.1 hypothetical protein GCM10011571_32040 [Marinithermofilum abyssi]
MQQPETLKYRGMYTKVPGDPSRWRKWEEMGCALLDEENKLAEQVQWTGGENRFPRAFQMLAPGGTVVLGAGTKGHHYTFMGKPGTKSSEAMLKQAEMERGESVLLYYGIQGEAVDTVGLAMMETAVTLGGRVGVLCRTTEQKRFLETRGYIHNLCGILTLPEIRAQHPRFDWPPSMPALADARRQPREHALLWELYLTRTVQPVIKEVKRLFQMSGWVDLVIERAAQDALGVSVALTHPDKGRIVYGENMAGRRYSFYAPWIQESRRRVIMPAAVIAGNAVTSAQQDAEPKYEESTAHLG